jgi:ribose/xylose/arabinose/galactoside ABC-type transport system permease subunit
MSPIFWEPENLLGLSRHLTEKGIIACGMTLVIMTGGIDLSVGSLLALVGIVLGYTWQSWGILPALGIGLGVGVAGGALNGLLITGWNLPPLVVTLATMALFRGIAMVISRAQPVSSFPEAFAQVGQGYLGPIPVQLFVWVFVVAITFVVKERTPVGRYATAIGDSERAALFAVLPLRRVKLWLYSAVGLLTALGAIIYTSRVSTAKADAGQGWELEVITAVVLGGTQISGGRGTVLGTFLGGLILGVVRNGLTLAGVSEEWQYIVTGSLLITTAVANERMAIRRIWPYQAGKKEIQINQAKIH